MRILVVDDERDVSALVAMGIVYQRPEYEVAQCDRGDVALQRIANDAPDLVLLDLAMPGRDGFSVLKELREGGNDVPVIVLTAKDLEQDKVRGLELGADDYITKPFSHKELLARIDAVVRRYRAGLALRRSAVFAQDDLRIAFAQRRVTVGERPVALTPTEYSLRFQLATNAAASATRSEATTRPGSRGRRIDATVAGLLRCAAPREGTSAKEWRDRAHEHRPRRRHRGTASVDPAHLTDDLSPA